MTVRTISLVAVLLASVAADNVLACEQVARTPISRPAGAALFVAKASAPTTGQENVRAELIAGTIGGDNMSAGAVVLVPWSVVSDCSPIVWNQVRDQAAWAPPEAPAFYVGWLRGSDRWVDGLPTIDVHTASQQPVWRDDASGVSLSAGPLLTPAEFFEVYSTLPTERELREGQLPALERVKAWEAAHGSIALREPARSMLDRLYRSWPSAEQALARQSIDEAAMSAAKAVRVHVLDTALTPGITLDVWLREFVGARDVAWDVNDCGEQTGSPQLDKGRDFPLCVEARATLDDERILGVTILIGTSREGVAGLPVLFSAHLATGGTPQTWFKRLSEIPPALAAGGATAQTSPAPQFVVRLPARAGPEPGHLMHVTTCGGDAPAQKAVVYVPGYQVVARELTPAEQASMFAPEFVELPTARLEGRLVDTAGEPLQGRSLDLIYSLVEVMEYCGRLDGPVPTLLIARVQTDSAGAFAFDVPAFHDDPFFQRYSKGNHGFRLMSPDEPRGALSGDNLRPSSFAPARTYPSPLVVVQSQYGVLSGHLGAQYLRQNGLEALDAYRLNLMPDAGRPLRLQLDARGFRSDDDSGGPRAIGYNAMLKTDGSFEVTLPPGPYDLTLTVLGPDGTVQRAIVVEEIVVVREGQRHAVVRP